jgi:phosphatidylserine/phosphatidylglycerophosphate/cardiolipin synthase-like enzyme
VDVSIPLESTDKYMHHKFVVIDDALVLSGSLNWTPSSCETNEDGMMISGSPKLIREFTEQFEQIQEACRLERIQFVRGVMN